MSLQAKSYEEALAKRQASDARKRSQPRTPMGHGRSQMKRTKMVVRRVSKKATSDGDSERDIRDECDELVRKIIRLRDSFCIVCQSRVKKLEVGHFIKREILALRWSLQNCNAQCSQCNRDHNDNANPYRVALSLEIGNLVVEELERIGRENPRIEYVDLLAIRDGLRAELERMKK